VEAIAYIYCLSAFPDERAYCVGQDFVGYLAVEKGKVESFADFG
jgi:hypothetical protein